jgi:hypothetical protein
VAPALAANFTYDVDVEMVDVTNCPARAVRFRNVSATTSQQVAYPDC